VYVWIWRRLPGGVPGKLLGCLILLFAVLVLLFKLVFPWAEKRLPFNDVTVDPTTTTTTPTPAPSARTTP
jgi:hypothetical protein